MLLGFVRGVLGELWGRWFLLPLAAVAVATGNAASARGNEALAGALLSFGLAAAALLIGSRLGATERATTGLAAVATRAGELAVQAVAILPAVAFIGDGVDDLDARVLAMSLFGGGAVTLWLTTAAATRVARGPVVLLGPLAADASLAVPFVAYRYGGFLGWETGVVTTWLAWASGSALVALWPSRPPPPRWARGRLLLLLVAVPVVQLVAAWGSAPRWTRYNYVASASGDDDGVAWTRRGPDRETVAGGTVRDGVRLPLPANTQVYAGPHGAAVFVALSYSTDGVAHDPSPNVFLSVPGEAVVTCDVSGPMPVEWREDGRAALVGGSPPVLVDTAAGCTPLRTVRSAAWLPDGLVTWDGVTLATPSQAHRLRSVQRLRRAGSAVCAVTGDGVYRVEAAAFERLGDPPPYGGVDAFPDGTCCAILRGGFTCHGSGGSTTMPRGRPVGPGVAWVEAPESHLEYASGKTVPLPKLPLPVDAVRVRGDTVDLFTSRLWYEWTLGSDPEERDYEP